MPQHKCDSYASVGGNLPPLIPPKLKQTIIALPMAHTRVLACTFLSDYVQPQLLVKQPTQKEVKECAEYSLDKLKPIELSPSTDSLLPSRFPFYKYNKYIPKRKPVNKPKLWIFPHRQEEKISGVKYMKRDVSASLSSDKPPKSRHDMMQAIFDWMMQAAALLKLTKNAFYRSLVIFNRISELDSRTLTPKKLSPLVCASLVIGAKFQTLSYSNSLRRMLQITSQRISRQELLSAEQQVLELLEWQVPIHTQIQEELAEVIRKWNDFVRTVSADFGKLLSRLLIHSWDKDNNKLYIEMLYIVDFLVLKNYEQFLTLPAFTLPIALSLYITTNVKLGDMLMSHHKLWPHFQTFLRLYDLLPHIQLSKFRTEAERYFNQLKIIEVMGRIPLGLELKKLIRRRDQQFYIKKIEYEP